MRPFFGIILLTLFFSCHQESALEPPQGPSQLYNDARFVLELHCGDCHTPNGPTPIALHIFDLSQPFFADDLNSATLDLMVEKLEEESPPPGDLKTFRQFVTHLQRRSNVVPTH